MYFRLSEGDMCPTQHCPCEASLGVLPTGLEPGPSTQEGCGADGPGPEEVQ